MEILTYNLTLGAYYYPKDMCSYKYDREEFRSSEFKGFVRNQLNRVTLAIL